MTQFVRDRARFDAPDVLTAALLLASCAITPRWAGLVGVADIALAAVGAMAIMLAMTGRLTATERWQSVWWIVPPLWIWGVLELFAVLGTWGSAALLSSVKDGWSLCFLLVPILLLGRRSGRDLPATRLAAVGGTVVLTAWVVVEGGPRPAGPFPDPTYTGSWLAMSTILAGVLRTRMAILLPVLIVAVIGLLRVQSFAALASLIVGYLVLWVVRQRRVRQAVVLLAVVVGITLPVSGAFLVEWVVAGVPADPGSVLAHLQFTSGIRWDIWSEALRIAIENPAGIGPGQFSQGGHFLASAGVGYETHNTFLEIMVEMGWLGLIAYVWLVWRLAGRGSAAASAMMVAFVCESSLHNTFNFRHLWIVAAIALLTETATVRQRPPAPSAPKRGTGEEAVDVPTTIVAGGR